MKTFLPLPPVLWLVRLCLSWHPFCRAPCRQCAHQNKLKTAFRHAYIVIYSVQGSRDECFYDDRIDLCLCLLAACSFRWFIVLKALFAGLLWEKNTAGWLLILLISPNEQGVVFLDSSRGGPQ
jgi:hypothetical protein